MTTTDTVISVWTGIDRFSVGCLLGLFLALLGSSFNRRSIVVPFLIPVLGVWVALPYLLSNVLNWMPYDFFQQKLLSIAFFTWFFDHIEIVQHDDYIYVALLVCCIYFFVYYANLAKRFLKKKEYLESEWERNHHLYAE